MSGKAEKLNRSLFESNLHKIQALGQSYFGELINSAEWGSTKAKFSSLIASDNFRLYRNDAKDCMAIDIDNKSKTVDWKGQSEYQIACYLTTYYGICVRLAGNQGRSQYEKAIGTKVFTFIESASDKAQISAERVPEQMKDADHEKSIIADDEHSKGLRPPVPEKPKQTTQKKAAQAEQTETTVQTVKELTPITALDCMEIIPKRYILDGLIEDETITLFSGREKIGKTYALMHMALCMAAGKPWLEVKTMPDVSGRILWLNLDMSRSTAQRRIYEITHGISEAWNVLDPELFSQFDMMDGKTFTDAGCKDSVTFFSKSDAVDSLKEYILSRNVKVCFIDNLIQIEGKAQENVSNDIQQVFYRVKQLRDDTQCSFIIIHHTTKDGGRFRGSGDISAETDLNLQLDQCEAKDSLLLKVDGARNSALNEIGMMKKFMQRIGDDGAPMTDVNGHPVNIFRLERIDTDGLNVPGADVSKRYAKEEEIVMAVFETANLPKSKNEIHAITKGDRSRIFKAIDRLCDQGLLTLSNKKYCMVD